MQAAQHDIYTLPRPQQQHALCLLLASLQVSQNLCLDLSWLFKSQMRFVMDIWKRLKHDHVLMQASHLLHGLGLLKRGPSLW